VAAGPEAFVEDLWPALRQAARIARSLEGRAANRPKEGEDTDVKAALTAADTVAQETLLRALLGRFGDARLEAEEDTENVARFTGEADAVIVIDPIDGTLRSYLHEAGPYAVMAGLATGGRFRAAVLALPREGVFVRACEGGGAFLARGEGEPRRVHARADGPAVMVSYDLPDPVAKRLRERGFRLVEGCGGAVAVAPLLPGFSGGVRVPMPPPLSSRGCIGLLASLEADARVATVDGPVAADLGADLPHVAVASDEDVLADLLWALEA